MRLTAVLFSLVVPCFAVLVSAQSGEITIRIRTELSESQTEEVVFVTVRNTVRLLSLSLDEPAAEADFVLPGPGTYLCFFHALSSLGTGNDSTDALGHGAMELTVNGGEVFDLTADYSRYEDEGAFMIGLVETGALGAGRVPRTAPPSRRPVVPRGSPEAGGNRSLTGNPDLQGSGSVQGAGTVPRGTSESSERNGRIRELEVRISRLEAELSRLELLSGYYTALPPVGTGAGDLFPMLTTPWSSGLGSTSPSPLEAYRQYLQLLRNELDGLRNGR